ncbi:hypothetical protein Tco_0715947 [Tanacetum coccineum]
MFRDTLKLPVETPDNPFVAPVNIEIIESFVHTVGFKDVVDKVSAFYMKFLAQPWQTMFKVFNHCLTTRTSGHDQTKINVLQLFHAAVNRTNIDYVALLWKKFPSIPPKLEEDYHSIKDDIPLQSTTLIPPPSDDRERDEITEATLLSLTLHKTTLAAEAQENVAKVQEKLAEKEIEKMVKGEEDKESYASEFADSMFNDDDDFDKVKQDEKKDDGAKKMDVKTKEKDNDDHTLVGSGSMETRNEQIQTSIPTPTRSPRKDLSPDKTIFEELTTNVSPTTATTSKNKSKRGFTSNKTKILSRSIVVMCRRHGQIHNHIKTKFMTHEFFYGKDSRSS